MNSPVPFPWRRAREEDPLDTLTVQFEMPSRGWFLSFLRWIVYTLPPRLDDSFSTINDLKQSLKLFLYLMVGSWAIMFGTASLLLWLLT